MAENLDDDEPPAPAPAPTRQVPGDTRPIQAPPDAGFELAVVSAIMGDPDGILWPKAKHLEPATLDGQAGDIWAALQSGVDPYDLFSLSKATKLTVRQLLEIADVDRAGATFSSGLRALSERQRVKKIMALGRELAEHPDRAEDIWRRIQATADAPDLLPAFPATALQVVPRTDRSCLLGNRFLNRGDGAILASNSGMGKSSMMLQMAVCWALELDFMGIKPNGPLRSLIMQSEDSEGDVAEVMASIAHCLKLTHAQLDLVTERVVVVTDRIHRGEKFVVELRGQVRRHKPDLVWINPLAAFADGDMGEAKEAGTFLREQLNGLNSACEFAYFIVGHTTKPPTDKGKTDRQWNEVQYNMAGSHDLTGWARAIISLQATPTQGEFNLILAKRGSRADVKVLVKSEAGIEHWTRTTTIGVKHATGFFTHPAVQGEIPLVFWEPRVTEPVQQGRNGRPKTKGIEQYLVIIPPTPDKALGVRQMHRMAAEICPISIGGFFNLVNQAVDDGFLVRDLTNPRLPRFYLNAQPKESA